MSAKLIIFLLFLHVTLGLSTNKKTFENVEVQLFDVLRLSFKKTILRANSLKDEIPEQVTFDHVKFHEQVIPALKEGAIADLKTLDELTIENCHLKVIHPKAFKNLPMLRNLVLKDNELEEILSDVFNGLPISSLDISGNNIVYIESNALDNLPLLLNIILDNNKLAEWDSRWFKNVPDLLRISVQNNSITKLPARAFHNLKKTEPIADFDLSLIFSHNKIEKIDENAFEGIDKLRNLFLDHNELSEFSENILHGVEVTTLRLDYNKLDCLQGNLDKVLKGQKNHLDHNSFDCKCLKTLENWAKKNQKNVDVFSMSLDCVHENMRRTISNIHRSIDELRRKVGVAGKDAVTRAPEDQVEVLFK
ncbi:leucine-rich repeat-containing protein egg-6-like [Anthonomus grandis grandis]|uniref:leucine-rich repeat-containing protein egg-6-like n=1 Tax=Anthonomus grandis grandis TaxID=2921223 RepID=UPI002164FDC0|nr:leucine-rich repeat-containing protein egg-6-like [Anthonomus grandis grandis]